MLNMVKVKICGITNLPDALAAVEAGADALGFNFYKRSPRYIAPTAARRIVERLPEGIECVGVFVNEDGPERVAELAREAGMGAVQLHGDETPEFCRALSGVRVIKALRVGEGFRLEDVASYETDALMLDAFSREARGGTGRTFDWEVARSARRLVKKLYLAGGLTPENVADAITAVAPFAVDACSGIESAPGVKDAARVRAFITAVRRAASL